MKMTQDELIKTIVKTLDSKKAEEIRVIGIRDLTIIADYFIIAHGNSSTQTRALADEVDFVVGQNGLNPTRKEGQGGSGWVILDYSDVVVHIFYKEMRDFYDLERLWSDGEQIDINKYLD